MTRPTSQIPVEPVFREQFGRSRNVLLLPLLAFIVLAGWVAFVQFGGSTSPADVAQSSPSASAVAVAASPTPRPTRRPTPEPTPTPTPPPIVQLFGPPLEGRLLAVDWEPRWIDLATGTIGPRMGGGEPHSRVLALPDDRFVCVCVREEAAGEERAYAVDLELLDDRGQTSRASPIGQWLATQNPGAGQVEYGNPFAMDLAHSLAGDVIAMSISVRRAEVWQRQLLLVDIETGRLTASVDLPTTPATSPDARPRPSTATPRPPEPRWAYAPRPRFSPDGRHVVLAGTVVGREGASVEQVSWLVPVAPEKLGPPVVIPLVEESVLGGDACRDAYPEFAGDELVVAMCWGDPLLGAFIRRISVSGERLPDVSLKAVLKDAAAPSTLFDGHGLLWLWDPWTARLARVDLVEGTVQTAQGPGGGVQIRMAQPSLVLSPDGQQVLVAAMDGDGGPDGEGDTRVVVVDAASLEPLQEVRVESDTFSLALSDDGRLLYVAHLPRWDDFGNPITEARLSVYDMETGAIRAILGRLGSDGFILPPPDDQAS